MDNPIIVALDGMDYYTSVAMAAKLSGRVAAVKVNDLFFANGVSIIDDLAFSNGQSRTLVMLDGKFHDIPNTIGNTLRRFVNRNGIEIVTVHASGGVEMMRAAVEQMPGKIAAVTLLTSLDGQTCRSIYGSEPTCTVLKLSAMAVEAGCAFVVCSGFELKPLSDRPLKKIVPGIRPEWYATKGDQKRVMTPREAIGLGADYLVMGRAITKADDPLAAVEQTLDEISKG